MSVDLTCSDECLDTEHVGGVCARYPAGDSAPLPKSGGGQPDSRSCPPYRRGGELVTRCGWCTGKSGPFVNVCPFCWQNLRAQAAANLRKLDLLWIRAFTRDSESEDGGDRRPVRSVLVGDAGGSKPGTPYGNPHRVDLVGSLEHDVWEAERHVADGRRFAGQCRRTHLGGQPTEGHD